MNTTGPAPRLFPFDGKMCSLRQISKITGIHRSTLNMRISRGATVDEAVNFTRKPHPSHRKKRKPVLYSFNGEKRTLAEIAAKAGVPVTTLQSRMKAGRTLAEAVNFVPRTSGKKPTLYDFEGEQLTLDQIAERTGIARGTLASRLVRASKPRRPEGPPTITFDGKTQAVAEWAAQLGLTEAGLRDRLSSPTRWALEQALTTPRLDPKTKCQFKRNHKVIKRIIRGFRCAEGQTA